MEFKDFKKMIESFSSLEQVNIGGGEPLLNRDLQKMVEFSVLKGIKTDISSNGLVFPDQLIELATRFPALVSLQINFPAAEESVFNDVTQTHGNFKILIDNIKKLAESELKPRLRLTLCKQNVGQIVPVATLARDLNLPLYIELAFPIREDKTYILSQKEVTDAYLMLLQMKMLYPRIYNEWDDSKTTCPLLAKAYSLELKGNCCAGTARENIYIDQTGHKKRCEFYG